MSKKNKLYLLILINLIAWGYVGYKIYGALQGDDDFELDQTKLSIKKIEETKKEDTILLNLSYPDPFLKSVIFSKENKLQASSIKHLSSQSQNIKTVTNVKTKQPIVLLPPPDIKYIGLVKNNDKGTFTAMISINSKSYFVKQKDIIEEYTIIEIAKDFVKLKKGKENLIINK